MATWPGWPILPADAPLRAAGPRCELWTEKPKSVIATSPDQDTYEHFVDGSDPDLIAVRYANTHRPSPTGLAGQV